MTRTKILLAALALLALASLALAMANVSAGDQGGGGATHMIRALLL